MARCRSITCFGSCATRTRRIRDATGWPEPRPPICTPSCPRSKTKKRRTLNQPLMRRPRSPFVVSPRITPDDFKSQRRLSAIGHELVRDLERDYRAYGVKAIEDLRKNEPWNYLRLLLSLVPPQAPSAE